MQIQLENLEKKFRPSVLTKINDELLATHGMELWLKRDDLLHPVISGNKWRKLKYPLKHALSLGATTLISMGGAYSNHLHALAYVGKKLGLKTIGLIRGERPAILTPTLEDAQNWGMGHKFISRSAYRELREHENWQDFVPADAGTYWLPEGGKSPLALQGVAELVQEICINYDTLCVPCGSGVTLAGLVSAVDTQAVIGFAALNHAEFLKSDVENLLPVQRDNWLINHDYHFGGFAKTSAELLKFIREFETKTGIPLEPVYTGKMLYGIYDLIAKGYFKPGQRIIAIHTGGLQGNRGFNDEDK